jgi:hypothetical protein
MKLTLENEENYAAKIVTLTTFEPIPNADRLKIAHLGGYGIIVSSEAKAGDRGVFFPIECKISQEFLSKNNLFDEKIKNQDQTKVGYFGKHGRVKAVRLRGVVGDGFFIGLEAFKNWRNIPVSDWPEDGINFDTVNGEELCRKYVVKVKQTPGQPGQRKNSKQKSSRLIEGSYILHYSTPKFLDNSWRIEPDDVIFCTSKIHGASFSLGRVKTKKILPLWKKVLSFILPIETEEWANLYSSRTVIKNADPDKIHNHYYKEDIWQEAFNKLEGFLEDGMQIYGELAGYTPSGGMIQKGYDYGCEPGTHKEYVYRITSKNSDGTVCEWEMDEVYSFCEKNNINTVPLYYEGPAKNLFNIPVDENWKANFAKEMKTAFNMEKDCEFCRPGTPAEGICVRVKGKNFPATKLKSHRFLEKESKTLDAGEVDIESEG